MSDESPAPSHKPAAKGAKGTLKSSALAKSEDFFVSECHKFVYHGLRSPIIENSMTAVILANFLVIILETDMIAAHQDPALWMEVAGWIVLSSFVIELSARVYTEREGFWTDRWNICDVIIVTTDAVFSLTAVVFGSFFPVSILRIFRLCKIARVSRVMRVFPELRLMMAGMIGAMSAIMWGAMLLAIGLLVWSIIAVQFIHPLNQELAEQGVYGDCERCGKAFQDVMSSCLTLFQQIVAGDSWGQVTIPIIDHYPASALYFGAVFLSVGMAILNLMLAVCVDVATQARQGLKAEMDQEKMLSQQDMAGKLIQICREMDSDNSGELTKQELVEGFDNSEEFRATLLDLDIAREDLEIVWIILDSDKSGDVSYTEFIAQLLGMKSSDSQFMLAYIKYYITIIREKMGEQMEDLKKDVATEIRMQKDNADVESKKLDEILGHVGNSLSLKPGESPGNRMERLAPSTDQANGYGLSLAVKEEKMDGRDMYSFEFFDRLIAETRAQQAPLIAAIDQMSQQIQWGFSSDAPQKAERGMASLWPTACQQAPDRPGSLQRHRILAVPPLSAPPKAPPPLAPSF